MSALADRYPGAQPFGDTALDRLRFRGRDTESDLLLHQLIGADLLVLFGKPGLGKTSLLNARLFSLLRERDFLPLPVRFNQSDALLPMQVFIAAIEQTCGAEKIDYTPGSPDSFWEFFKTAVFWRGDLLQIPVLVLDQFEEIFTLQTEEFRRAAAAELGELVSRRLPDRLRQRLQSDQPLDFSEKTPEVKVLLSLREDDLGMLQELTPQIPSILQNRFRLTSLSDADARRAITEPAASERMKFRTKPFAYEPGTVEEIVTAARSPRGGIDPFVLQLICGHVERKVLRKQVGWNSDSAITVDSTYLGGKEGMRAVTVNFYLDSIKRLPQPKIQSRARSLCEEGLLTENGRRRSMLKDELLKRFKLGPDSLQLLEQTRLLRSESRGEDFYYEISHDRIAEAIHQSRKWRLPREVQIGVAIIIIITIVAAVVYSSYRSSLAQAEIARIKALEERQRAQEARKSEAAAKSSEKEANDARDQADGLINFMLFDLGNKLSAIGRLDILDDVVKKAQDYLQKLPKDVITKSRQHQEWAVLLKLGDIYRLRGNLEEALNAYQQSLEIIRRLAEQDPTNRNWQSYLSNSYETVGDVLRERGDLAGALNSYLDSLAMRKQLAEQGPSNASWQSDLSSSYERLGDVLRERGDLAGALKSYRQSLAFMEQLAKQDPDNAGWQRNLSNSYERLGDVSRDQGDLAGALKSYRQSLAIREQLAKQDPNNANWQSDLSNSYERMGDVLRDQSDLAGALNSYGDSLAIREKLTKQGPGIAGWRRDLSNIYERLGDILRRRGDLDGALNRYHDSLAIREQLVKQDPDNVGWQRNLSNSYERLGEVLRDQGDLPRALTIYHSLLAIREKLVKQDPSNAGWQGDLAFSYFQTAKTLARAEPKSKTEAREMIRKAQDILRRLKERTGLTAEQQGWLDSIESALHEIGD